MPGKARPRRSPAPCGPQRSHLFSQNTAFPSHAPASAHAGTPTPHVLAVSICHESAKDRMASMHTVPQKHRLFFKIPLLHTKPIFFLCPRPDVPTRLPMFLPVSISVRRPSTRQPASMFPVGAHANQIPMGNRFPYFKIPTFHVGAHASCRAHASQIPMGNRFPYFKIPTFHVGAHASCRAHASQIPMGNQSPCLKIPTLRISPHPKNPHRETQPCDMPWWTAARDSGRRKARPARRNGAGDGRRGIGGPVVGVPATAGTSGACRYGRPIGRWCLAGTTRGPLCPARRNGAAYRRHGAAASFRPCYCRAGALPPGLSAGRMVYGARRIGAAYRRHGIAGHGEWCRLSAARHMVPPDTAALFGGGGRLAAGLLPGGHGAANRRHCTAARQGGSKWGA